MSRLVGLAVMGTVIMWMLFTLVMDVWNGTRAERRKFWRWVTKVRKAPVPIHDRLVWDRCIAEINRLSQTYREDSAALRADLEAIEADLKATTGYDAYAPEAREKAPWRPVQADPVPGPVRWVPEPAERVSCIEDDECREGVHALGCPARPMETMEGTVYPQRKLSYGEDMERRWVL